MYYYLNLATNYTVRSILCIHGCFFYPELSQTFFPLISHTAWYYYEGHLVPSQNASQLLVPFSVLAEERFSDHVVHAVPAGQKLCILLQILGFGLEHLQ
jgi:hypothetical protein